VKKLVLTVSAMAAAFAALRNWRMRKADAELWQEATAPRDLR
jgi:hypothetical protein